MLIKINDLNYHTASLDVNDIKYVKNIIIKTINKYPELDNYIKLVFKENYISIEELSSNELVINIFAAILNSLKDDDKIINEEQMLKIIKRYIRVFLKFIFINRKIFIESHPIQYEPKVVYMLSLSNYITIKFSKMIDK